MYVHICLYLYILLHIFFLLSVLLSLVYFVVLLMLMHFGVHVHHIYIFFKCQLLGYMKLVTERLQYNLF